MINGHVIDTNVLVTANDRDNDKEPACVIRCLDYLEAARESYDVLLDLGNLILEEYYRYCNFSGQPGAGDRFYQWLFQNQAVEDRVRKVPLTEHSARGFEEFPNDADLTTFDPSDRKFVATAIAGGGAEIAYAADRGWRRHREALLRHPLTLNDLCSA